MKLTLNDSFLEFIKAQSPTIKSLRIVNFNIDKARALQLLNSKLSSLETIIISDCKCPKESSKSIAEIIKNNATSLKVVDISKNFFSEKSKYILDRLKECSNLQYLNLEKIQMNGMNVQTLENQFIEILKATKIQELNLNSTKIHLT